MIVHHTWSFLPSTLVGHDLTELTCLKRVGIRFGRSDRPSRSSGRGSHRRIVVIDRHRSFSAAVCHFERCLVAVVSPALVVVLVPVLPLYRKFCDVIRDRYVEASLLPSLTY